ncbi:DNA polymerase [Cellvibrio zantedeschiae]|uniref:DNA polymerase n=1 Tax=Cellvibrio zantedeschiae TaxID=1237077 RepID=A0ABQ3AXY3_9GAMM|nr:DNA polymerase II [Cellvibrio zantedeschiae]GGY67768.1 DNA polymerase [Cellvibrio zantedeschiae]
MPNAFLLTRQWRDTREGIVLDFWWATEQGACWTQINRQEMVFFILRKDAEKIAKLLAGLRAWRMAEVELKTFLNLPVNALYFKSQRAARDALELLKQANLDFWESDIRPHERYLMERFITAGATIDLVEPVDGSKPILNPRMTPSETRIPLKMVSLDIETSMDAKQLFSIAVWAEHDRKVFMVGEGENSEEHSVIFCATQKACLQAFLDWLHVYDPDILIGWSVVQFDLWVLETLCQKENMTFELGRAKQAAHWRQEDGDGRRYIIIPGRVALDGIELLKAANYRFESYSLQFVSEQLLDKGKLLQGSGRGHDIARLFVEDKLALADYNLRDCELVWEIFEDKKLLHFAVERSQLTGLLLDRIGGSVAAFEYLYLPRLHRKGYVAPNLGELESDVISPGGYVMNSRPGIYDNILVLDFKSLYPSIIRTFLIDPCAFWIAQHEQLPSENTVAGFNGAYFAREGHILPHIIEHLWSARDVAKREKNAPLSHAIKIIMNSFYGVLGSTGCRFFDPRVCSSITLRGHDIIQRSRDWIEQQGYSVIYGDTDSLFVWVENNCVGKTPKNKEQCQKIGDRLARELNQWWQAVLKTEHAIKSHLEIQFETHYLRFLMPTIRGSDLGTKKRYAGVIEHNGERELVFKGLENVRTDWTRLAKDFQEQLYSKVFAGEDYLDFVRETVSDVLAGKRNDDLIYNKRLRRHLHEYEKNVPPQVQAARKYVQLTGKPIRRGDWIAYVITTSGAEPISAQQSPLDYQHYVDKQLMPVADSILHFMEQNMTELVDTQMSLFVH